jgi:hypothetical protein
MPKTQELTLAEVRSLKAQLDQFMARLELTLAALGKKDKLSASIEQLTKKLEAVKKEAAPRSRGRTPSLGNGMPKKSGRAAASLSAASKPTSEPKKPGKRKGRQSSRDEALLLDTLRSVTEISAKELSARTKIEPTRVTYFLQKFRGRKLAKKTGETSASVWSATKK